jgi:hypothetical protein
MDFGPGFALRSSRALSASKTADRTYTHQGRSHCGERAIAMTFMSGSDPSVETICELEMPDQRSTC